MPTRPPTESTSPRWVCAPAVQIKRYVAPNYCCVNHFQRRFSSAHGGRSGRGETRREHGFLRSRASQCARPSLFGIAFEFLEDELVIIPSHREFALPVVRVFDEAEARSVHLLGGQPEGEGDRSVF